MARHKRKHIKLKLGCDGSGRINGVGFLSNRVPFANVTKRDLNRQIQALQMGQ